MNEYSLAKVQSLIIKMPVVIKATGNVQNDSEIECF